MTATGTRVLTYSEAINEAIRLAMRADPTVIVMGEDVVGGAGQGPGKENAMGGTFGATRNLYPRFGPNRVRDTPISEAGFVGAAIGAAATGLRPVVDVMWSDFTALAFEQIYNQASKMRYMFGGQVSLPVVLRVAMGSGLGAAAQHSGTLYSLYTHVPGLKTVVPASPHDAKGLLLEAIADDNPVIIFEHLRLYPLRGHVPEEPYRIPLGQAAVRREGTDVTIVAISFMVEQALEAARVLAEDGVDAEVIDPRTLSPLDEETLLASVAKTGAVVVVDESPPRCSAAADIAAIVSEKAFDSLNAPVRRLNAAHAPVPFSPPLERAYAPSAETIVEAVRSLV